MLRRAFVSRFPALAALFAVQQPSAAPAQTPSSPSGPAKHPQDDWFDDAGAKHRVVFDTSMADTFGDAVTYASNWIRMNKEAYGLSESDVAVIIVARHGSGPFAFNEAMWTKYGKFFAERMSAHDKVAHPNPTTNIHAARLSNLAKQGLRLAVCNLTTRAYVKMIADANKQDEEAIYKELTTNTVAPAHFVPAGVVGVTRAQEYGYKLVSVD
jgi:intracellular sulfur oxidation DsrE/DsrF family protein